MGINLILLYCIFLSTGSPVVQPISRPALAVVDTLPTLDLSSDTARQVIVARGTASVYQGQPTTVLLSDGKTIYCVWTINHGGACGPLARSLDGGRRWSGLLKVPGNWDSVRNCPTIYRLPDPQGRYRLFVFAGQGPDGSMYSAYSEDKGISWSPMRSTGLPPSVMPFCTIVPIDGGKRLLAMTNLRKPGSAATEPRSNVVAQSISDDGGFTWSKWRIVLNLPGLQPCEPELVRSPSGKQLLCLMRENVKHVSLYMTSDDEGKNWSLAHPLPAGLFGDRHQAAYAPDGRLVVVFRDTGKKSSTKGHFVAWIGTYDDIIQGRPGQYRLKLLHNYKSWADCGYAGLEVLPDGEFVATTYIKYRPGPEKNSIISVRFNLKETDHLQQRP